MRVSIRYNLTSRVQIPRVTAGTYDDDACR